MRQLFFLNGHFIGEAPRTLVHYKDNVWGEPASLLFMCGTCGEVYAEAPVMLPGGKTTPWQAIRGCCEKCSGELLHLPGSLWLSWDAEFQKALPYSLLEREFRIHLKFFGGINEV